MEDDLSSIIFGYREMCSEKADKSYELQLSRTKFSQYSAYFQHPFRGMGW